MIAMPAVRLVTLSAALALLSACSDNAGQAKQSDRPPMAVAASPATAATAATEAGDWETHCIGRFLVDLPPGSEVVIMHPEFMESPIRRAGGSREEFREEKKLEREIFVPVADTGATVVGDERFDDQVTNQALEETAWLGCSTAGSTDNTYGCHGGLWSQNFTHSAFTLCEGDERQECVQRIRQVLTRFRPREDQQLPDRAGFCVNGGVYEDAAKPAHIEKFNAHIYFRDHPDLSLLIASYTPRAPAQDGDEEDTRALYQRQVNMVDTPPSYQALYTGPQHYGARSGQALITREVVQDGHVQHIINWYRPVKANDPIPSRLEIALRNAENRRLQNPNDWRSGVFMAPTLTLDEMQALMARIVPTLRPQAAYAPAGPAPQAAASP